MRKTLITFIFIFTLVVFIAGCSKISNSSEEIFSESEYTDMTKYSGEKLTESSKENQTEKAANQSLQGETPTQQDMVKNRTYVFEQACITEIYVDGKLAVKNEYKNGLRAVKKGIDYCEFTYDSWKNITSEVRNGKLITYLYKDQLDTMYVIIYGFNYEGKDYYYARDEYHRIIGISNDEGELIARYEYDEKGFKVSNVLEKVGDKWVINTDEKFIGNFNRIRYTGDYYDIETDLYYSNSVFFDPETNNVIQYRVNKK